MLWMIRMQEIEFPGFKFEKFSGGVQPTNVTIAILL
jgi:hypothetical protein